MLNKAIARLSQRKPMLPLAKQLVQCQAMSFSGGPYNPLQFKTSFVPEELPSYVYSFSLPLLTKNLDNCF